MKSIILHKCTWPLSFFFLIFFLLWVPLPFSLFTMLFYQGTKTLAWSFWGYILSIITICIPLMLLWVCRLNEQKNKVGVQGVVWGFWLLWMRFQQSNQLLMCDMWSFSLLWICVHLLFFSIFSSKFWSGERSWENQPKP